MSIMSVIVVVVTVSATSSSSAFSTASSSVPLLASSSATAEAYSATAGTKTVDAVSIPSTGPWLPPPAKEIQSLACRVIPETPFTIARACGPPGIRAAAKFNAGLFRNLCQPLSSGGSSTHIIVYSPAPANPLLVSMN